jgi:hypothetical protein
LLQFSATVLSAKISLIEITIGSALTLKLFAEPVPLNLTTPNAGALLASQPLPAGWLAAAASAGTKKSGTLPGAYWAEGTVTSFRIEDAGGVVHVQGTMTQTNCPGDMTANTVAATPGGGYLIDNFFIRGAVNFQ